VSDSTTRKWQTELPDDETTVLLRLEDADWPIMLGWHEGGLWHQLDGGPILCEVIGWMHVHEAVQVLDTVTKGGVV
jgi:hypothetical protein